MSATETLSSLLTQQIADFPLARELRLVAPKRIASVLGGDRRTVEQAIFRGELPSVRAAGRTFASIDAVLEWFESRQHPRRCRAPRALVADSKAHPKSRTHRGVTRPSARRMSKAAR